MPIRYFPEVNAIAKWGSIVGQIDEQTDLIEKLNSKAPISHLSDFDNPHNVNKSQVGLSNLSNHSQLKRDSNDFNSFPEKINPSGNDIILIEDSENDYEKRKAKISTLGTQSGNSGISFWLEINANVTDGFEFYFSGTEEQSYEIQDSIFTCQNSSETITKRGIIKSASYSDGTIWVVCIADNILESGDKNFKIANFIKTENYSYYITIPGELVADSNNPQGTFFFTKYNSFLLIVDANLITSATGTASVTWNIYKDSTALFNSAPDFSTNSSLIDLVPNNRILHSGDLITLRILTSSGNTKPADLKLRLVIIPEFLIYSL